MPVTPQVELHDTSAAVVLSWRPWCGAAAGSPWGPGIVVGECSNHQGRRDERVIVGSDPGWRRPCLARRGVTDRLDER